MTRYYTVSKKDTTKFHKDSASKKKDHDNVKDAVEKVLFHFSDSDLVNLEIQLKNIKNYLKILFKISLKCSKSQY